jgi:hypothetical protein
MANATSLANRIEAIFEEEEPEQDWLEHRVSRRPILGNTKAQSTAAKGSLA